jgi:hypothetical protein
MIRDVGGGTSNHSRLKNRLAEITTESEQPPPSQMTLLMRDVIVMSTLVPVYKLWTYFYAFVLGYAAKSSVNNGVYLLSHAKPEHMRDCAVHLTSNFSI